MSQIPGLFGIPQQPSALAKTILSTAYSIAPRNAAFLFSNSQQKDTMPILFIHSLLIDMAPWDQFCTVRREVRPIFIVASGYARLITNQCFYLEFKRIQNMFRFVCIVIKPANFILLNTEKFKNLDLNILFSSISHWQVESVHTSPDYYSHALKKLTTIAPCSELLITLVCLSEPFQRTDVFQLK